MPRKEIRASRGKSARKACRSDTLRMLAQSKAECIFAACCTALCFAVVYGLALLHGAGALP